MIRAMITKIVNLTVGHRNHAENWLQYLLLLLIMVKLEEWHELLTHILKSNLLRGKELL